MWNALTPVLNGGSALSDADKQAIQNYFVGYKFKAMTNTSAEALGELADEREGFIRDLNRARSAAARDHIIELTLGAMRNIASNNFHPAVRYNAVLIISQLDRRPPQTAGGAQPPEVHPEATQILLWFVTSDQTATAPSSVKVAALVGLQRHARFGIDQQFAQPTTDAMLSIINAEERPTDVNEDVFAWMKCQAAGVLVRLHAEGMDDAVSNAIVQLIANDSFDLDDRCYVASLLANSMFSTGENGVDFDAYQTALGGLAKDVFVAEAKKANEYNDAVLGEQQGFGRGRGMRGGRGIDGGGFGRGGIDGGRGRFGGGRGEFRGRGGFGFEEDAGPHYETRRMLDRVMGVLTGVEAIAPAAPDPVKTHLNDLMAPLRTLADVAVERDALEVRIVEAVLNAADAVSSIIDSWGTSEDSVAATSLNASTLIASD